MDIQPPLGFELIGNAPAPPDGFELVGETPKGPPMSAWERFKFRANDIPMSILQAGEHLVPQGVKDVLDPIANKLGFGAPPVAKGQSSADRFDSYLKQREQSYRPPEGTDWAGMAGGTLPLVPLAAVTPAAATLKGAMALGAATGGATGMLQPVTQNQDQYWTEKAKQAGTGAVAGAVAAPVARGVARVISPDVSPEVRTLLNSGVTPTPGNILGGAFKTAEDKLTSMPILGDAITGARRSAVEDFNRAAYGRALNPIGGKVPQEVGRSAVNDVSTQLSNAYERLLPNMTFAADAPWHAEVNTVRQMASTLPETQAKRFEQILQQQVLDKLTPAGLANGAQLKQIESQLGKFSRGYGSSPDFDQQQLGSAISEVQASMRRALERSNPQYAAELQQINKGYASYVPVRRAAGALGSADGVFTPAQYSNSVRAADSSVAKGNYARGTARNQDLSDAGKQVIGSTYPDSGSIGRLLLGGAVGGGGYLLSPHIPLGLAAASLPYLPYLRQGTAALLARRPDMAAPIAEGVRRLPVGLLAPALIQGYQ